MEFAILLPLIMVLVLFVAQAAVVVVDQVQVVHAAREAARAVSLSGNGADAGPAARSAAALGSDRLEVDSSVSATVVSVVVRYRVPVRVPLLRSLRPDIAVSASVAMRREDIL